MTKGSASTKVAWVYYAAASSKNSVYKIFIAVTVVTCG